jgi:glycosyltransferase involved in cell wall biosynthesis
MSPAPIKSLTYVTRLPPSPSGVALYAARFKLALEVLAPTRVIRLPPLPKESQRLRVAVQTFFRALTATKADPADPVVFELAGRGIAEFWTALLLSGPPFRRRVWVTVHDSPAVSGGAFFFTPLDRRGFRRLAALLSKRLGRRAERALMRRADRVYCLSALGARQLIDQLGLTRPVQRLPHVTATTDTAVTPRRSIFLPGYLGGVDNVAPNLRALAETPSSWRLEVGACDAETDRDVALLATDLGVYGRVALLGHLNEEALGAAFERAAIVVRWRVRGWARDGDPQRGAVSGPLIEAMAHGCAIITNDTRGIAECLPYAKAVIIGEEPGAADKLQSALVRLINDEEQRSTMAAHGRAHVESDHSVVAVSQRLATT